MKISELKIAKLYKFETSIFIVVAKTDKGIFFYSKGRLTSLPHYYEGDFNITELL
jgi:hypothetical protein